MFHRKLSLIIEDQDEGEEEEIEHVEKCTREERNSRRLEARACECGTCIHTPKANALLRPGQARARYRV
jgi:hypothetical protein